MRTLDVRFEWSGCTMFVEAGAGLALRQGVVALRDLSAEQDRICLEKAPTLEVGETVASPAFLAVEWFNQDRIRFSQMWPDCLPIVR